MTWLFVCLGAAVGAPARYLVDRAVRSRRDTLFRDTLFPWGILAVNVVGSLVLGLLIGGATHLQLPSPLRSGLGVGFCGTLTTYSTFGYETFRLLEEGSRPVAVLNVVANTAAGFGAAALGYVLGVAL